jgi:hypothetical protein
MTPAGAKQGHSPSSTAMSIGRKIQQSTARGQKSQPVKTPFQYKKNPLFRIPPELARPARQVPHARPLAAAQRPPQTLATGVARDSSRNHGNRSHVLGADVQGSRSAVSNSKPRPHHVRNPQTSPCALPRCPSPREGIPTNPSKLAAPALSCTLQGIFRSYIRLGGKKSQETPQPPPSDRVFRCPAEPQSVGGKARIATHAPAPRPKAGPRAPQPAAMHPHPHPGHLPVRHPASRARAASVLRRLPHDLARTPTAPSVRCC